MMKTETLNGIDVLQRDDFVSLRGQRVGLITNHTGLNRDGQATADLLHAHPNVRLTTLFGPEHGIRGALDENVPDGQDARTGLPVYSLYGTRTRPLPEQLANVDTLVFDIQDVGTRFYTYISTLGLCMEAAAQAGIPFVVLDRPNPLGGAQIEGALADADKLSFTAHHSIPVRHGLTVGEMARLFQAEKPAQRPQAANPSPLIIASVENWQRGDAWDRTGLTWTNPSPNMRSLTQAFLYPGIGLLEFTNVSVGRGTDTPFEVVGAPWSDGRPLARVLNGENLPGVRFVPIRFTPTASKHVGQVCGGVNIIVTHRDVFHPVMTGFAIACALRDLYPKEWDISHYNVLLANAVVYEAVKRGANYKELTRLCAPDVQAFHRRSAPHLLYA
jgi:uncharacterized protein YbbC (DUF1343 family)